MANINRNCQPLIDLDTVYVFDDFTGDQSDITAVDTITDSGTALVGDAVNGVITLTPSDGSVADNDECYLATPNELFLFGTNREIYGRFKFRFTAVVAADPNWAVGFMNAPATSAITDDGGVKVSGSTLAIEKKDGETAVRCTSSCNGSSTTTLTNFTLAAATDYIAEIHCKDCGNGTSMQVSYKFGTPSGGIDWLKDTNGNVIRHTVAIASATEMAMFAGIKLGAATNNDTFLLDYWYGSQSRV